MKNLARHHQAYHRHYNVIPPLVWAEMGGLFGFLALNTWGVFIWQRP